MTKEEVRKLSPKMFMRRVIYAEKELRTLKARLAHYEDMGLSITAFRTDTPVTASRGSSRTESAAVGMVDTLNAIQAKVGAYSEIVSMAEELINRIPQENYRRLLTLRYLAGMSFRSVSDEMNYTDRNSIYRAHGFALMELGRIMRNV